MKRIFSSVLVCILLASGLGSCEKTTASPADCGKEVVSLMAEMASNEDWMVLRDIPEMYGDRAKSLRAGDYTDISAVYELTIPEDALLPLLSDYASSTMENLPDNLREYVRDSIYIAFASRINASAGNDALAISSLYSAQMVFHCPDAGNSIYLYVFENGYPIAVAVTEGEDGAVKANGNFLLNDAINTENATSIEETLEKLAFLDVTVAKQ